MSGFVYLLKSYNEDVGDVYKIGISKNEIEERLRNLKTGNPNEIEVIHIYKTRIKNSKLEARLHRMFKHLLVKGEWYNLSDEDVNNFVYFCEVLERALLEIEKPPY